MNHLEKLTIRMRTIINNLDYTWDEIMVSPSRKEKYVHLRASFAICLYYDYHYSCADIATIIKRDRSTVSHYCQQLFYSIEHNYELRQMYSYVKDLMAEDRIPWIFYKNNIPKPENPFETLYILKLGNLIIPAAMYSAGRWMTSLGGIFEKVINPTEADQYMELNKYYQFLDKSIK